MDQELIDLRNKFLLGIAISLLLIVPLFFIIKNISYIDNTKVIKRINKNEEFILLLKNDKCDECKKLIKTIKKYKFNYMIVNIDTDRNYNNILKRLSLTKNNIKTPTIIYIKDKKVDSYIVEASDQELKSYLKDIG